MEGHPHWRYDVFLRNDGSTGNELWAHRPFSIDYHTNTGGAVTSWAINASLPSGVSFGTNNGTIYGTPTELWTQTSYMVWANNSGGSSVAYLNITVNDEAPVISYSTTEITGTIDVAISPHVGPTTSGGTITSWEISPNPGSAFHFNSNNGYISGTPSILLSRTQYTIWANNSGGSSVAYVNVTINDAAPGPFEYNPENNTWTNNTEVHLAPNFVNITTGNGTTWTVSSTIFTPYPSSWDGICFAEEVDGVLYLSGSNGLYGYGLQNHTIWHVSTISMPGCWRGSGMFAPTELALSHSVGDTLFFSATGSNGTELYAYNTVNTTTWLVADINQGTGSSAPGVSFFQEAGDVFLFSADDGSSGTELWAHDTSNGTTWRVADINSGAGSSSLTNKDVQAMIGDVVLFRATDGSSQELWAYNLTNTTVWQAANLSSGVASPWGINGAAWQLITVGDVAYFGAIVPNSAASEDRELHAYNVTNQTAWTVTDVNTNTTTGAKSHSLFLLNDVLYFKARVGLDDGYSCVAHAPANATTWVKNDGFKCPADFGTSTKKVWIGGILYSGNSAYNPDNQSTWYVINSTRTGGITTYTYVAVGDVLYFSGGLDGAGNNRRSLWAHDTTNGTTWFVEGSNTTTQNYATPQFIHASGNTALFQHAVMSSVSLMAVQAAEINSLVNTGGPVTSYAINASLPSGLSFGTNNGTIYGTPTELWTQTSYMVWANNSGGSSVAYLNITVVDQLPTLSYSPSTLVLTINTSSTDLPLNATLTGSGTITSWAISPALPSGLSFGTSNGTIWGTPTSLMTLKTFTIWANNSGGSSSATVNITVNDEIPDISYSPDWFVLTNNTAMSPTATPTNSGGAIPSGILDSNGNVGEYTSIAIDSNGFKHISYYDTGVQDLKYATDKSGSWVVTTVDSAGNAGKYTSIAIDSNDAVHISYQSGGNLKYATCSSSCATASNWDLVSVDTTSNYVGEYGSIAIDSNDTIHISYYSASDTNFKYATCSNGCTSASNWTNVSVYTTGVVGMFTSIAIDSNDALHVAYWNSSSGHTGFLKYATCSSDCTNTSNWNDVSIATYNSRYGFTSLAIDSNDAVHISYRGINSQWPTVYTNLNYATCSSGCTTASNWDVVSVDTASYRPTYTSLAIDSNDAVHISYGDNNINGGLRYATCSTGCTSGSNWNKVGLDATADYLGYYNSIAIDANDAVHIAYRDHTNGDLKYIALDASSNMYGYSISPDLPAGLSFNAFTGEISGTPTELLTNTTFTITARNSGGTNTTTITIEVIDPVPTLSYSPQNLTLRKNTTSSNLPLAPTIAGPGAITSWAISPALPSGLSFGTSNGTIWGTPTAMMTLKTYTIWGNNSGGSANATVNITVTDPAPNIAYNPDWFVLTNNTAMSPTATPTNSGGAIPSGTISSIGNVGHYTSIAIDSNGYKHISYLNYSNFDLEYATDKTGTWTITVINDEVVPVRSNTSQSHRGPTMA